MPARFRDPFPILQVSDVRRSRDFYVNLLGFEANYAFPPEGEPVLVSLSLGVAKLAIGAPQGPVQSASTALWLYTDDVDAAVGELEAAGVPVVSPPADQPWGERVASLSDPDGYVIHLGAPAA